MRVDTDAEFSGLRELLRDLVALSAIPGVWIEREHERAADKRPGGTPAVAAALAEAVVELLELDFVFLRLSDPGSGGAVDVTRGDAWKSFPEWLDSRLAAGAHSLRKEVVPDVGADSQPRRGFVIPIGPGGEAGVLATARDRGDFPTTTDQLLLSLAADQAATAFQTARLVHERSRAEDELREARNELEMKVAERTAELLRSEAYLAEGQRLTRTGSFAIDVSSRTVSHSSDEHSRLYGFDPEQGTPSLSEFVERVHPEDRAACVEAVEAGIRGATTIEAEYRVVLPQGPARRHRVIAHPVFNANGELEEIVGTIVDVTERRQAEAELERLAGEQAALRRVATLVAQESPPPDVFAKVAEELGGVIRDVDCLLARNEGDGTASVAAAWGTGMAATVRVGERFPVEGNNILASVLADGRPRRIDDLSAATGPNVERARQHGMRSAAGAPIVVGGRIWGVVAIARYTDDRLPPDTESRLVQFAELVATAIANADARAEVERLAEEQAALRRVATLVAEGAAPPAVLDAVAAEMERLLEADGVALGRYEPAGEITVVAHRGSGASNVPPGTRVRPEPESVSSIVRRTERPARMESYARAKGAIGELAETLGVRAAVGAPVVLDGRLWGLVLATWSGEESPPADTEERMVKFAQLLDTAVANADSRDQLTASRTRLLTAADEARRRVVRDLHDGAQQRLVHTIITLKLAQQAVRMDGGDVESLVHEALGQAEQGNAELRKLSHGILPAVLTRGGLRAGVDSVVVRLDLPVEVNVPPQRFPAEIEASAYFIVAEALTNVVKHAHASVVSVGASADDGVLEVEVRDDGIGGADPTGHGLMGLSDRVTALGGRLDVESPAGGGTLLVATLPLPAA